MKRILITMLFITFTTNMFGSNLEILNRALDKLDYEENIFRYETEIKVIGKKETTTSIVSFDPNKDPKVTLILVDGREPTKKDIKKYKKQEKEQQGESSLQDLLGKEYKLLSEDNGLVKFTYKTSGDLIPKKDSKMNGEIWVDTVKESIIKIILNNDKKIDVAIGVSINTFKMEFLFKEYNSRISVVTGMNMSLKGKAVLTQFDQISKSKIYNYTLVN